MNRITPTHVRGCLLSILHRAGLLCLVITPLGGWADAGKALPPPAQERDLTYHTDIRPLFERSCFKCHGEEKQKAKLRLDSRQAALTGAKDGKVILPGKSAQSKLVLAVSHATQEEDEWMPPPDKAQALTAEEIGLIRAWIDQGAH